MDIDNYLSDDEKFEVCVLLLALGVRTIRKIKENRIDEMIVCVDDLCESKD